MINKFLIALTKALANKEGKKRDFWQLAHFYFRGMAGGGRRLQLSEVIEHKNSPDNAKSSVDNSLSSDSDCLIGVWNYTSRPYSLGDTLNFCMELAITAIKENKSFIDIYIIADAKQPAPPTQTHISAMNYEKHLFEMLPAFNMCPAVRNVHLVRDRKGFEKQLIEFTAEQRVCYPNLTDYFEELDNPKSYGSYFKEFNDFYEENGYLPNLKATKGASVLKDYVDFSFKDSNVFVAIHMRQRQADNQGSCNEAIHRDAEQDVWVKFIEEAQLKCPQVVFVIVGRFYEFPKKLFRLPNTIILKSYGLGISEELNAILDADLFMGSNSGPATVAFFSDTPYFVYQDAKGGAVSASLADINVGDRGLKFAANNQIIKWSLPTYEELEKDLTEFLNAFEHQSSKIS